MNAFTARLSESFSSDGSGKASPISKQPLLCSDNSTISFVLMTLWDWRCQLLATK